MGKVSKIGGGPIGGESWIVPSGMVLKFPDGLIGTPSLTFTSDTDSGFYRIGSDEIGMTLGGVLGYDFSSTALTLGSSTVGKNLNVTATLDTEKVTWTAAGWDEGGAEWTVAGTPIVITHATGNTTALTSTLASAIVANTTYKVVITYTQVAGSCTYTLGGITGTSLNTTGATVTDYITAYSTAQMVITPLTTSNIVISSISIKALTDATGDVVIDGNLTVRSPFISPILLSVGSASNPSFAFGLESTLGWYRPVAGTMGLAISSAERLRFTAVSGGGLLEVLDASHLGGYALSATIGTPDVFLTREAAAILQLGLDAAGVTNQMFKGPDRITSDGVGGNLTIAAGRNRGASVGGSIIFQTSPVAGGTVTGTLATVLTLDSTRKVILTGALDEAKGTDIASATTTDIGAATGSYVEVTGAVTITGLGTVQAGTKRIVRFTSTPAPLLTYNATSLILPGARNIQTEQYDRTEFISLGSGNWVCVAFLKNNGRVLGDTIVVADGSTSTVDALYLRGHTHRVTGAYTLSLPTAAVGYSALFFATTAAVFSLDVITGTDIIVLDGTALAAGNKATSDGTINAGIYVECTVAGYYHVYSVLGVFVDGGA